MIIDWKILLLTLPLACSLLVGCYVVGLLLSRLVTWDSKYEISSQNPSSNFWKLLGGLIFIIGIYAIITTHFRTSLLPIPVLACALIRLESVDLKLRPAFVPAANNRSTWIFLFGAIFFYWVFYALHFLTLENNNISYTGGDTLFYARAADFLNYSGVESVTIDYSTLSDPKPEPYHYGDLWMTALVQKITFLPAAVIVSTIVYPVLAAIFFLGLGNFVLADDNEKKYQENSLLLLCGFTSGFSFLFPSFLFPGSFNPEMPLVFVPKLFFAGIFFIAILLSCKKESWNSMLIIASAGSLLFINIAPAILITTGGVSVYWLIKKRQNIQIFINPIYSILSVSALVYFFTFYKTNSPTGFNPAGVEFRVQTFLNILLGGLLQLLPLSPFFLLFFLIPKPLNEHLKKWQPNKNLLLLIMFLIAGLVSWGIFYTSTPEAVQFFSNTLIPVSCIVVASLISKALLSKKKKIIAFVGVISALSVLLHGKFLPGHARINKEDVALVSKFLQQHKPGKFASIQGAKTFNNSFVRNTMVTQPLSFITYLCPQYFNTSLTAATIFVDSSWTYAEYEKNVLAAAPFNQFIKKIDTSISMEEYSYLFVIENKLRYLAISPDTSLPKRLVALVKDSVTLSNHWNIYFIK